MYVLFESTGEWSGATLRPTATFDDAEEAQGYANAQVKVPVVWTPTNRGPVYSGRRADPSALLFEIYKLPHNPKAGQ